MEDGKSESSKAKSTKVSVYPHGDDGSKENPLKSLYLTPPRLRSRSSEVECRTLSRETGFENPLLLF